MRNDSWHRELFVWYAYDIAILHAVLIQIWYLYIYHIKVIEMEWLPYKD